MQAAARHAPIKQESAQWIPAHLCSTPSATVVRWTALPYGRWHLLSTGPCHRPALPVALASTGPYGLAPAATGPPHTSAPLPSRPASAGVAGNPRPQARAAPADAPRSAPAVEHIDNGHRSGRAHPLTEIPAALLKLRWHSSLAHGRLRDSAECVLGDKPPIRHGLPSSAISNPRAHLRRPASRKLSARGTEGHLSKTLIRQAENP